jgi:purine-binding chemotaxis protein CheW
MRWLVCRRQGWRVALPAQQVIETMRPLHTEPMSEMPPFVLGVAVVRGTPTPVVDVGLLLGAEGGVTRRWVTVSVGSVGERSVALAVDSVEGVRDLPKSAFDAVPPLLRGAAEGVVEAIGALDGQLLAVLEGTHLLTDEQWVALGQQGRGS